MRTKAGMARHRAEKRLDLATWLASQIKEVVNNLSLDGTIKIDDQSLRHNLGAVFGEIEGFDCFYFDLD